MLLKPPNARSLRNFMMQGCGAECAGRLCAGTENGIEVSAAVHDAVFIIGTY